MPFPPNQPLPQQPMGPPGGPPQGGLLGAQAGQASAPPPGAPAPAPGGAMPPAGINAPGGMVPPPPPPIMLHDVTVVRRKTVGQARVASVPPEEFGISRRARSIAIQDAHYCFHAAMVSEHDLIQEGFDPDQVRDLPMDNEMVQGSEAQRRDTVAESAEGNSMGMNAPNRMHKKVEHYCWLDYEDDKPRRYKVVTAGGSGANIILKRKDGKKAIEEVDQWPFAAMTPVIQTHRFFGRSLADLVMDIQRIKTALLRSILDNTYLLSNQRMEISELHTTDSTLDDMLSNRPGGIIRTKMPGGLLPVPSSPIGEPVFGMISYMDDVRDQRTGVSRQQTLDPNSLQKVNIGENALLQMNSSAQARMKLIARIFAETGFRDLFLLLHAIVRKNSSAEDTVKLRGQWVTVNPRDWKERRDMTVSVGLGAGDKPQQLQFWSSVVLPMQQAALQAPQLGLVKASSFYNTAKKILNLAGEKAVDQFFTDPDATGPDGQPVNPPQQPPDPKMLEVQGKMQVMQASAQSDIQKTQADIQAQQAKTQSDITLQQQKFELESKLAILEANIKQQDQDRQAQITAHNQMINEREIAIKEAAHNNKVLAQSGPVGGPSPIETAINSLANLAQQHAVHMQQMSAHLTAPKRVVRGPDGKVVGVETVTQ